MPSIEACGKRSLDLCEFRRVHESGEIKHSLPYGGIIHFRFKGTEHCAHLSLIGAPSGVPLLYSGNISLSSAFFILHAVDALPFGGGRTVVFG